MEYDDAAGTKRVSENIVCVETEIYILNGIVDMMAHGKYFFITAEDGSRYFSPFSELERKVKKMIRRHSNVVFDISNDIVPNGKLPKAVNVSVVI